MTNMTKTKTKTIIKSIETFDDPNNWMGYEIKMSDSKKNITCKIENYSKCCEVWGVSTKSDVNKFIGAEYNSIDVSEIKSNDCDEMIIIDITITTNKGNIILQFYNEHNGFYSHDLYIQSETGINIIRL